jgi:hypothetical protein
MSTRNEILKEILSDSELMEKHGISLDDLKDITPFKPGTKKIVDIMATIINENDNDRTPRQIYSTIKNIHKI